VRLRQILLNLLGNAHKFTASGHVTLGAEVAPPHLHIWVADTGCGIPVDLQERIFEPFVTGRHDGQRPQGVGLGLTITRRLVALHRGTMTLESQPGRGSTFHVYVPLPSLSGQLASAPAPDRAGLLLISSRGAPSPAIAELCWRKGLKIYRLQPGEDVQALLASTAPAVLAWDLGHATASDWLLVQQLRSDPRVCQAPFILYGQERVAQGQAVGAVGILSKPLGASTLLELIEVLRGPATGPILIVDDDAETRALYQSLVAQALPGHPVRMAESGAEALALLEHEIPALLLLDLMMPDVDGFAVLEHLRAEERTRHVPVVIMSGRILSLEDVKRIDHARVIFHSKDILAQGELAAALRAALGGQEQLPRQTSAVVKHAIAYIQHHYMVDLSRQQIALAVGVSKNYLTQIFHQELGISPWEYLSRYRIKQAKELLRGSDDSITVVAARVGFDDASYFGRVFRKQVGCSPQSYREAR
jgi:AraC-like DNA-binding protein